MREEVAAALGLPADEVFKTLVVECPSSARSRFWCCCPANAR